MKQQTRTFVSELSYQMAAGIHTYGVCSAPGCKHIARGSAHCEHCVRDKLAKVVGDDMANKLYDLYKMRGEVQSDIDELLSEF